MTTLTLHVIKDLGYYVVYDSDIIRYRPTCFRTQHNTIAYFCAISIDSKKSELMLIIRARACIAGNLGLFPSISSQFTLLQPKIAKNH